MSSLQSAAIRSVRSHWVPRAGLHPLLLSGLSSPAPQTRPSLLSKTPSTSPPLKLPVPLSRSSLISSLSPRTSLVRLARWGPGSAA